MKYKWPQRLTLWIVLLILAITLLTGLLRTSWMKTITVQRIWTGLYHQWFGAFQDVTYLTQRVKGLIPPEAFVFCCRRMNILCKLVAPHLKDNVRTDSLHPQRQWGSIHCTKTEESPNTCLWCWFVTDLFLLFVCLMRLIRGWLKAASSFRTDCWAGFQLCWRGQIPARDTTPRPDVFFLSRWLCFV